MKGIIDLKLDDNISFKIINIKNIHSSGKYKDFRITIEAKFFNLKEWLRRQKHLMHIENLTLIYHFGIIYDIL